MSRKLNKKSFKTNLSSEDCRKSRQECSLNIRKEKKDDHISKKRNNVVEVDPRDQHSRTFSIEDLPMLMDGLLSENYDVELSSMREIRRIICTDKKNPPIRECINFGAIPIFVRFLQQPCPKLQFEAAWVLTNIASSDYTKVVVDNNAIPHLVNLLLSNDPDLREQSAWCLGNIAGENSSYRNMIIDNGGVTKLIHCIRNFQSVTYLENCVWALSNICRGKPIVNIQKIYPALSLLAQIILSGKYPAVSVDSIWALSYVSEGGNEHIDAVIKLGIIHQLIQILDYGSAQAIFPVLRVIGNISTGTEAHTDVLLDHDALRVLDKYITCKKASVRKEVCWILSNIAAGNPSQVQKLLSYQGLIPKILQQMSISNEFEVRREARFIISNVILGKNVHYIRKLIQYGVIGMLIDNFQDGDDRFIWESLDLLETIFKEIKDIDSIMTYIENAEGIEKIEALQQHRNNEIYEKALHIVENYFQGVSDEDERDMPITPENPFIATSLFTFQPHNNSRNTFYASQRLFTSPPRHHQGQHQPDAAAVSGFPMKSSLNPTNYSVSSSSSSNKSMSVTPIADRHFFHFGLPTMEKTHFSFSDENTHVNNLARKDGKKGGLMESLCR